MQDLASHYESAYRALPTAELAAVLEVDAPYREIAQRLYRERFCPICDREMLPGRSVDEHHLVPRSRGGRDKIRLHRVCHRKLHSLFSERDLAKLYCTVEALRAHPDVQAFVRWVARKEPTFYSSSQDAR